MAITETRSVILQTELLRITPVFFIVSENFLLLHI